MSEPLTEDHTSTTHFPPPKNATKFKGRAGATVSAAWFDTINPQTPSLWLQSQDGEQVCVPFSNLGLLKKLLRRGRNP